MLTFKCESCKKKITTDDSLAGQQGECPFCKAVVTAPGTPPDNSLEAARCHKCGARRPEMKRTCGFCGADFDTPAAEPPKTRRVEAKTTKRRVVEKTAEPADRRKVAMILGGVAAVGLIVLGVQFFAGGDDDNGPQWSAEDRCRMNLMNLHNAVGMTAADAMPKAHGSAFWVEMARKFNVPDQLQCPSVKSSAPCDYRGPIKDLKDIGAHGVILCDRPDAHKDGINVLHKNGEVTFASKGSPLYEKALAETAD